MNLARRIALAAVLAIAAAAPAMADEWWTYRGGPKGPPSLTSPDSGPVYGYGDVYGYAGLSYRYGYGW